MLKAADHSVYASLSAKIDGESSATLHGDERQINSAAGNVDNPSQRNTDMEQPTSRIPFFEEQFKESKFWSQYCAEAATKSSKYNLSLKADLSWSTILELLNKVWSLGTISIENEFTFDSAHRERLSRQFWVTFLDKSSPYTIAITSFNMIILLGLSTFIFAFPTPTTAPPKTASISFGSFHQYQGVAVMLLIWVVVNGSMCGALSYYQYLRRFKSDDMARDFVPRWIQLGSFLVLLRFLTMVTQLRSLGIATLPADFTLSIECESASCAMEIVIASLLLNVFQTYILSIQPFPWPWSFYWCIIQVTEIFMSMYSLRHQWSEVPSVIMLELYLYIACTYIYAPFVSGKLQHFNIEAFRLGLRYKTSAQQKRQFVEMLCSDIRLPLQYIGTAIESLPLEQLNTDQLRDINRSIRTQRAINFLVESVFALMKIDENTSQPLSVVKLINIYSCFYRSILEKHHFHTDAALRSKLKFDISNSLYVEIDERGFMTIVTNLLYYACALIDELTLTKQENFGVETTVPMPSQSRLANEHFATLKIQCVAGQLKSKTRSTTSNDHSTLEADAEADSVLNEGEAILEIQLELAAAIGRPIDPNVFHLLSSRAIANFLDGSFSIDDWGNIRIRLPCQQRDKAFYASQQLNRQPAATALNTQTKAAVGVGVGIGVGQSQVNDESVQQGLSDNVRRRHATHADDNNGEEGNKSNLRLPLKVAIIPEEEGIEACVSTILDVAVIQYEVSDLQSILDSLLQQQATPMLPLLSEPRFAFDIVFASKVRTCEILRQAGFQGKIIICSTWFPYLETVSVSRYCDFSLSIPCTSADSQAMIVFINDDSLPSIRSSPPAGSSSMSKSSASLATRSIASESDEVHSPRNHRTIPTQYRRFSDALQARYTYLKEILSFKSLSQSLVTLKFFVLGDFVSWDDDDVDGLLISKHLDYLPNTTMGMTTFQTRVEKNFFLWKSVTPDHQPVFEGAQRLSLLVWLFLQLQVVYYAINVNSKIVLNSSLNAVIILFLTFREYSFRYIFSSFSWLISAGSLYYLFIRCGLLFAFYSTLSALPSIGISYYQQLHSGSVASLLDFVQGFFYNVTGSEIFLVNTIFLVSSQMYDIYYPWPISIWFAGAVLARHFYYLVLLRNFIDPRLALLMFMMYIEFSIYEAISFYQSEFLHRGNFRSYRKMAHSDRFMGYVILTWTNEIKIPMKSLSADKPVIINALASKFSDFVGSQSTIVKWNMSKFGYMVMDGVLCQLNYRGKISDYGEKSRTAEPLVRLSKPVSLANEVFILASSIKQDLTSCRQYDLNITYKVDHHLAFVKTDMELFRTVLGNALTTACRSIQRGAQGSRKELVTIHNIHIRICLHKDFVVHSHQPHARRLKFVDPRLMVIEVLDTSAEDSDRQDNGDDVYNSDRSSFEASHKNCKDIAIAAAESLSLELGSKAFYVVNRLKVTPSSSYTCIQRFTIPFKIDALTSFYARDDVISNRKIVESHVGMNFDTMLVKYQKWAQKAPYTSPKHWMFLPEGNLRSDQSPLMLLVYERPPQYRGVIRQNSPYFQCLQAFHQQNWRYQVIYDISSPESIDLIKQASCVVIDSCEYNRIDSSSSADHARDHATTVDERLQPASPNLKTITGGRLFQASRRNISAASYLRAMGYMMITIGTFTNTDSKSAMQCDYDAVLVEPISTNDWESLMHLLRSRLLPLLLKLQLNCDSSRSGSAM